MSIVIREALRSDIESMVVLMRYLLNLDGGYQINDDNLRKGFMMALQSGQTDYFVASADGKTVGMCGLHRFISTVEGGYAGVVEDVVVMEECSGMGIGGLLLEHVENFAKETGLTRLHLLVDRENSPAISLYSKCGWEETRYIGFRKYI
jgi:ribosomal protein S18 acetylase RimI-like enzyme